MTNRRATRWVCDEAGNVIGGTGIEVRCYSDFTAATLATIYKDSGGSFTRANPGYPNSGWQTTLTVAAAPTDTSITVGSTTGVQAGDMFPLVDGLNTFYAVVKTVTDGTHLALVAAVPGAHTYAIGSTVGDQSMYGHWQAFVADVQDYDLTYKNVATSKESPPDPLYTLAPTAPTPFSRIPIIAAWGL